MDPSTLNWPAILLAALSSFLIGGLWYSPVLFGNAWMSENKFNMEEIRQGGRVRIFLLTFIFSLMMSINLAMFLNDDLTTPMWGMTAGFLAGFGWVAMSIFIIGLFERKSIRYMLINAGYVTISLMVMGLIIGLIR
jgi:hypothetical protein